MRWSARRSRVKRARKQVRPERWRPPLRLAVLYLPSYQGEALGEPAHYVEPVEHMASVGKVLCDGLGGMGGTCWGRLSPLGGTTRLLDP